MDILSLSVSLTVLTLRGFGEIFALLYPALLEIIMTGYTSLVIFSWYMEFHQPIFSVYVPGNIISYQTLLEKFGGESIESNCPVCFSSFDNNQEVLMLDCRHYYCKNCIKEWAREERSCPMCRRAL